MKCRLDSRPVVCSFGFLTRTLLHADRVHGVAQSVHWLRCHTWICLFSETSRPPMGPTCWGFSPEARTLLHAGRVHGVAQSVHWLRCHVNLSLLRNVQTVHGAYLVSYSMRAEAFFPEAKRPAWKADHRPPSSAEVKNTWSYTSAPPVYFHGVRWDNVAFTLNIKSTNLWNCPLSSLPTKWGGARK